MVCERSILIDRVRQSEDGRPSVVEWAHDQRYVLTFRLSHFDHGTCALHHPVCRYLRAFRGVGWQAGHRNEERFMKDSRLSRLTRSAAAQRRHGWPARP